MHLVVEVEGVAAVLEVTVEPARQATWKLLLPLKIQVTSLHWAASDALSVLSSHSKRQINYNNGVWKCQCFDVNFFCRVILSCCFLF